MPIPPQDEYLLNWFFSKGQTQFFRSTMGTMLERAEALAFDSAGNKVEPPDDPWLYMLVKPTEGGAAYEPDSNVLQRFGWVSRRLRPIASTRPSLVTAMATHYGDSGARWEREKVGRLFSLYPLTPSGRMFLRANARRHALEMRPDDAIAVEVKLQELQPNDIRRRMLKNMAEDAGHLRDEFSAAWDETSATCGPPPAWTRGLNRFFNVSLWHPNGHNPEHDYEGAR